MGKIPPLLRQPLCAPRRTGKRQAYLHQRHEEAGVDPGRQDRQCGTAPLESQELVRRPDVLRGLRRPLLGASPLLKARSHLHLKQGCLPLARRRPLPAGLGHQQGIGSPSC